MSYEIRNAQRAKKHFSNTPQWQKDRDIERGPCVAEEDNEPLTLRALRAFCDVNNRELTFANEYGEPGYTNPTMPACILLADWNAIPKSLQDRLDAQGYQLEWSDEWYVDGGRTPMKAWRTQPDHNGWESRVRLIDGNILTPDDDPQRWIDDAMNVESRPLPSWFADSELEERGFQAIDQADKEVGLHPGQNETPDKAGFPELRADHYDVILQITGRSQFDTRYCIWTRKEAT